MPAWLDIAWEEIGQQEISGEAANPRILTYFKEVGRPEVHSDEIPWCAAFAFRCLELGGIDISSVSTPDRLLANNLLKIGTPIKDLRIGAVCVLSRGSDKSQGHVGFIVGSTQTDVVLLGGNQGDKVSTAHFSRNRIRGIRWPETVSQKQVDQASRIALTAKQITADTAKTGVSNTANQMLPTLSDALPQHAALARSANELQASLETGIRFAAFSYSKLPWVVAALSVYWVARIAWNSNWIRKWRHEDAAEGKSPLPSSPAEPEGAV